MLSKMGGQLEKLLMFIQSNRPDFYESVGCVMSDLIRTCKTSKKALEVLYFY